MRILLAGATGAIGRLLTPLLIEAGHQVTGTTRTPEKIAGLEAVGARGAVMEGLDPASVRAAVDSIGPEIVIHQLTALSAPLSLKKFDQSFARTNTLRTTGTDLLLAAAQDVGAARFIAQSYTGWPNERTGGPVKDETDPIDPHPTTPSVETVAAIGHLEHAVTTATGIAGVVLRYGSFYGPGTGLGPGGDQLETIRRRGLPVVGGGTGVWSFCHIEDAATATLAAVDHGAPGVYNIVDDDPAPVSVWLPEVAAILGAKPPLRLPGWIARPLIGEHGMSLMTQIRGSSNAKAKAELGWTLRYPSWRDGFRDGLY